MEVRLVSLNNLLTSWHWLCTDQFDVLDINDFGDLFLESSDGRILMLDVQHGELKEVANSVDEYQRRRRKEDEKEDGNGHFEAESKDFKLAPGKVFGYKTARVFTEKAEIDDTVFIADLYEYLRYVGDLQNQVGNVPDGTKVKVVVTKS